MLLKDLLRITHIGFSNEIEFIIQDSISGEIYLITKQHIDCELVSTRWYVTKLELHCCTYTIYVRDLNDPQPKPARKMGGKNATK